MGYLYAEKLKGKVGSQDRIPSGPEGRVICGGYVRAEARTLQLKDRTL